MPTEPKKKSPKNINRTSNTNFSQYRLKKVTSLIRWGNGYNHVKC